MTDARRRRDDLYRWGAFAATMLFVVLFALLVRPALFRWYVGL